MKDSLNTLKELASSVRNATKEGENSAERIGRLFEGILEYIKTPESIENYFELKQDSNGLDYIYTKYNIASAGALSMYASDKINVPSIYDGLPIDNDTIYWHEVDGSKVLKAKGGGGEAGSVQWDNISGKPSWIEDTKPSYSWSDITGEKPFYTKEEIASKYVTIDTEQEITALKHFTAGLSVGESKKKIYEENGVVYIDADVAVTGAMTFYASAGRSVSTIMDGVTVDEETITKGSDNVLRIKNAGAGSSFDENAMWSALSGSSDNQINKSHLTNALAGYATESWVTGKGYATESWVASKNYATTEALNAVSNKLSDFLEGSDTDNIINKWKELEAFLSGMAETDNLAEILETKADKKYVDSTFVTLATKQTITGEKTFSSVLNTAAIKASGAITAPSLAVSDWVTIAGVKLRKLEDGALMLEGNLALTGALTMYASNGQSFDTIYDGLPIDGNTIYWEEVEGSKVLKAREGSGSSFDKNAMWTALSGGTTEQINKSHLTTALTGYATESWVTSKNYLTSVSIATISDLHANWDALLKAAPSAYVTRWPTISEVTDRKNLIIKLNGGSTEGTNLFTYNVTGEKTINITPAGIGAAASSHNHSWSNITSGKPSTLSGYGITDGVNSVSVTGTGNAITSASISGHSLTLTKGSTFLLSSQYTASDILAKLKTVDGAGSDLDADILALTGETGSLTGTNLPTHVGLQVFQYYKSGNGPTDLGNFLRIRGNNGGCAELFLGWQSDNNTNYIWYKSKRDVGSWGSWKQIAFTDMNVASASRLQNLKKIWGNLFDGSQNVEGNLDLGSMDIIGYGGARILQNLGGNLGINPNGNVGIGNTAPQYKLHVSGVVFSSSEIKGQRYVLDDIGATGLSSSDYFLSNLSSIRFVNDIAVVQQGTFRPIIRWGDAMDGIGYNTRYVFGSVRDNTYDWGRIFMAVSNNDAGTSTGCSFSMYGAGYVEITGNILTTGGSTFYGSDIRYKSIIHPVMLLALNKIAEAPSFVYRWNRPNMNQNRLNLGGSAQYTQSVLPWAVEDNDNFLMMDYATVAYTFAVHTARHLLTYETRTDKKIKKLEREIVILKKQLKKLGYEEVRTLDDSGI